MVSQYIKELLQESDEVIVQDLGTFQTSYHSAEIHPATHAFTPPSKNINFNTKLKMSNFLLENYIAQKENIPLESAKEEVQKFVSGLKVNLGIEKRIAFDSLGEMVLQVSDELEFKQNKQINLLSDSFGLPEIYAKPIERSSIAQKNTPNNNNNQKKSVNTKAPVEENKSTWGTIAAIGSLAFVVLAVIYVVAIDSSKNPFHSLLGKNKDKENKEDTKKLDDTNNKTPEDKKVDGETKPEENTNNVPEEKKVDENTKPEENTNNVPEEKKVVEEKKQVETPKGDGILVSGKENKYYIVIGGFASQANAYKKANEGKSKGLDNMKVVPPFDNKNLYRVAVGGFSTKEQADSKLEEVKSTFGVDAWILKY